MDFALKNVGLGNLLQYAPMLLSIAQSAPAFLIGSCLGFVALFLIYGTRGIKMSLAEDTLSHLLSLAMAMVIVDRVAIVIDQWTAVRQQKVRSGHLAREIKMIARAPKLD